MCSSWKINMFDSYRNTSTGNFYFERDETACCEIKNSSHEYDSAIDYHIFDHC